MLTNCKFHCIRRSYESFKFFGLRENCFTPSLTPAILPYGSTNACLFKCKFVIEERQGLSLIVGKIGFGKTSVLRELVNGYVDDENYKIALLPTAASLPKCSLRKPFPTSWGSRAEVSFGPDSGNQRLCFPDLLGGREPHPHHDEAQI